MNNLPDWLVIGLWRSLLGEIYPDQRAIAAKYDDGSRELLIRYYVDRKPNDFDFDSLETVSTYLSSSIGGKLIKSINIESEYGGGVFSKLDPLDGFIYIRREYEM